MLRDGAALPAGARRAGLAGLLNLVVTVTGVVLLPLSEESWGHGDAGFGVATACLGFGALGAPLLARLAQRSAAPAACCWSSAGAVALVAAHAGARGRRCPCSPWPAPPAWWSRAWLTGTLQDAVPDRYRAGALGLADTIMVGACLVGSLVAPALATYAGARPALLVVALAAVLPVLAVRLLPPVGRATPYDASGERTAARPDPRGAPAVGAARLG